MSSIFNPSILGCPICSPNGGTGIRAHLKLPNQRFIGHLCGHEFSLFESLNGKTHGFFSILQTYASWTWSDSIEIKLGKLNKIPVPYPSGVTPFAAFLTSNQVSDGITGLPKIFAFEQDGILISNSAFLNSPDDHLGLSTNVDATVYCYEPYETRGWVKLLFDGLNDFSNKQFGLAVFKLVTALEIACESIYKKYLEEKNIPEKLAKRLLADGKNWHSRIEKLSNIAEITLIESEFFVFKKNSGEFLKDVRSLRNIFAHDSGVEITQTAAVNAFATSFPIIWSVDKIFQSYS